MKFGFNLSAARGLSIGLLPISVVLFSGSRLFAKDVENITLEYTVVTPNAEKARLEISKYAETSGGYLEEMQGETLTIRIKPQPDEGALAKWIASLGTLRDKRTDRKAVGEAMGDLETRISIKRKHLESLYKLFSDALLPETLEVEQEVMRTIEEMERMQGDLKALRDSASRWSVRFHLVQSEDSLELMDTTMGWVNLTGIQHMNRTAEE